MRTKRWTRFSSVVDTLIAGFKCGEIVVIDDVNADDEQASLLVISQGESRLNQLLATPQLVGAELAVSASGVVLEIATKALRTLFGKEDVAVSLWTLNGNDQTPEYLIAHHLEDISPDRLGSSSFGKMPVEGSPCGDAIKTGTFVYFQMSSPPNYGEFAEALRSAGVGSLTACPLRMSSHTVAVLLVESHDSNLLISNQSTNRVLTEIVSLFERVFNTASSRTVGNTAASAQGIKDGFN